MKLKEKLFSLMLKELRLRKKFFSEPVRSIYFGGGTPSLLISDQIKSALDLTNELFKPANPEITLECNPDDLSYAYLEAIFALGINRLSIGIQSFHDDELKFMNRVHTSEEAVKSLENARKVGFLNLNLDLIYGVPGSSLSRVRENVERALSYNPEHISMYSLTIEPNTVFGNWHKKGKLVEEQEEEVASQYEFISEFLTQSGYIHYEISNFARPGYESYHNSSYWKRSPYLGIGPAAHSFNGTHRQFNIRNNAKYIEALERDIIPMEQEFLSMENRTNEYIMTSLRTIWGCNLDTLNERFNYNLMEKHQDYISELVRTGKATLKNNTLALTLSGKLLADQITSYLFL